MHAASAADLLMLVVEVCSFSYGVRRQELRPAASIAEVLTQQVRHAASSTEVSSCMQIWNRVKAAKPAEGSGLTRDQFGVALRLVAFAQNEPHPTPEAMEAAASSAAWQAMRGKPLPAPQLLPDARSAPHSA